MSDVASAQNMMRGFVDSRHGENLKHRLWSAAAALGWPQSRAKAVLYGEARVIKAREMEELRKAAKANHEIEEMANDYTQLTERLARMETMLAALVSHVAGEAADLPQSRAR